jgi:high-affinity iron transporter
MLINTVILFLRDALPIFVLLGLLLAQVRLPKSILVSALLMGFLLSLIFIQQVDSLGMLFDGAGLEISLWILHVLLYLNVLLLGYAVLIGRVGRFTPVWWGASLIVIMMIAKGTNFLLYFNGFLNQIDALQSMTIGTLLGLGICLSLAILLFFFTMGLKSRFGAIAAWIVLLIFASGQLMNSLHLLVQVDLLHGSGPIWNSQWLIDDESEYGHLFNVLFGYVAAPNLLQIGVFTTAIVVPLVQYWRVCVLLPATRGISQ